MKHRISEGASKFRSPSPSPLLRPRLVPENGEEGRKPGEDDPLRRGAEEELDDLEEEDLLPLEKQDDGEETGYMETNDREMESDDEGDEYDKDYVEEEEEGEEDEVEELEEEIDPVDGSEGNKIKLADGFYEVEAIRKKRICKGEPQYFIKWRGWPESANTWEPLEHLDLCPDVVEVYEQNLQSGKKTRKRKRKYTQPKKKLQYSYATSASKETKKSKAGRKPANSKPSYEPSTLGTQETNGDENSSEKDNDTRKITIQLQEAAKGDGSSVNSSSKTDSAEPSQGDRRTGAKRRKSGSVQRFKPEFVLNHDANSTPVNGSYDSAEQLAVGNMDTYPKNKFEFSRDSSIIMRILKPIGYSTSKSNDTEDVLVTFVALRSDGKEVVVDNKFLKANYPNVLIDFYEKHLRYSPAS